MKQENYNKLNKLYWEIWKLYHNDDVVFVTKEYFRFSLSTLEQILLDEQKESVKMIPKYRAWVECENRIVDVEYIHFGFKEIGYEKYYNVSFNDIKLMQSTGYVDINGKEIYEGYIVRDNLGTLYIVKWVDIKFILEPIRKWHDDFGKWENIVVVGNIYENKELLKCEN